MSDSHQKSFETSQLVPKEHKEAAQMIKRLVNNRLFNHGDPKHSQFLHAEVEVGVGLENPETPSLNLQQLEVLNITLRDPHIETIPNQVKKAVLKTLEDLPIVKDHVQFDDDKHHKQALKEQLEEFVALGADLPKEYLQWRGFATDVDKETWDHTPEHALNINKNAEDINVVINVTRTEADNLVEKPAVERVADNIRSRAAEIKETLKKRVLKYSGTTDEAAKQKLAEQVDRLEIEVLSNDYAHGTNLNILIRSPEQKEAAKNAKPGHPNANQEELNKSNPLFALSKDQLGKALGRAILHSSEAAQEVFPIIAGREDMRRALCKSLCRLKKSKPELAQKIDKFMNDDVLKSHQWEDRKEMTTWPRVTKDAHTPGEMQIQLLLPEGKAHEALKKIAALDVAHQAAHSFAQVDTVEVVGGSTPEIVAQARDIIASVQHPAQSRAVQQQAEQSITPLAEKLVTLVREANNTIDEAVRTTANVFAKSESTQVGWREKIAAEQAARNNSPSLSV